MTATRGGDRPDEERVNEERVDEERADEHPAHEHPAAEHPADEQRTDEERTDEQRSDEDRAALYALLGRLWYDGPDEALLRRIAASPAPADAASPLAAAWSELARACAYAGEEVRQEYEDLFIGPGKADVSLYLTNYSKASGHSALLVDLRRDLERHGATRRSERGEPEDHIAALCDLMRLLITRGEASSSWPAQQHIFNRYVAAGYPSLCDAVQRHPAARFYRHVARVCDVFLQLEARALADD